MTRPVRILLSPAAAKFIKRCPLALASRMQERLDALGRDPFPSDAKRVLGRDEKTFRIRVGAYRVLYVVLQDELLITDIDKRERIY